MDTRRIGSLTVSLAGLGCNNFGSRLDEAASREVVAAALDAGITFFDTADIYGSTLSEQYLGRALGRRRDEVVLATKFGIQREDGGRRVNGRPEYVRAALDASLQRLGVDHIDLYYQHRVDPDTPIEETWGALAELAEAGKIRYAGISEASAATSRSLVNGPYMSAVSSRVTPRSRARWMVATDSASSPGP